MSDITFDTCKVGHYMVMTTGGPGWYGIITKVIRNQNTVEIWYYPIINGVTIKSTVGVFVNDGSRQVNFIDDEVQFKLLMS